SSSRACERRYHGTVRVRRYGAGVIGRLDMSIDRSSFSRPLIAAAMVAASVLGAIAQQPPVPTRVRGTIEGVEGDVLSVKSRSGENVKLHMTGDMKVVGIIRI